MLKPVSLMLPFEFERVRGWWWIITLVLIAICLKWPLVLLFLCLLLWRSFELATIWSMTNRLCKSEN